MRASWALAGTGESVIAPTITNAPTRHCIRETFIVCPLDLIEETKRLATHAMASELVRRHDPNS